MRFAVVHKAATYLMVGFAYLAMTTGGGISGVVALAGFGALVTSWWWEPPRINLDKWTWVWTVTSVFALAYSVLTAIVTGDFLGVGAQFLTWLIVAKSTPDFRSAIAVPCRRECGWRCLSRSVGAERLAAATYLRRRYLTPKRVSC